VGRKNHYGSKSRRGTEVASTFYTLIETAKLHGVNPADYLFAAVRATDQGEVLMPWEHPQAEKPSPDRGSARRYAGGPTHSTPLAAFAA
jgi:hypothetical protein